MPLNEYTVITGREDIGDRENWRATLYRGIGTDGRNALIDREGDTESEAIVIAVAEWFGDIPEDTPYKLPEH